MTPQERELIMKVAERVQNAPPQTKDPQAEQLIREQMARQPDATYLLTQAVIVQEYGLQQAQERIQSLEQEIQQARSAQTSNSAGGGSFLGGLFGSTAPEPAGKPASPSTPNTQMGRTPTQATGKDPGRTGSQLTERAANQSGTTAAAGANRGGMGDFMRNAAMMAVGVAGGHMLFNSLQGMFNDDSSSSPEGDPAVADATTPEDSSTDTGAGTETAAEDSSGWGADQGVSEEALSGDPALWEQPEPAADSGWGDSGHENDEALSDGGMDAGGFDDTGLDEDFGGDDDWG